MIAASVAVRDGRFVAVGPLDKVKEAAGKDTKINRTFANKVVIAGLVEQHVHPVRAALTMNMKVISIEDRDAGCQIHIHNNGDAGFDVVLGELEKATDHARSKKT